MNRLLENLKDRHKHGGYTISFTEYVQAIYEQHLQGWHTLRIEPIPLIDWLCIGRYDSFLDRK